MKDMKWRENSIMNPSPPDFIIFELNILFFFLGLF